MTPSQAAHSYEVQELAANQYLDNYQQGIQTTTPVPEDGGLTYEMSAEGKLLLGVPARDRLFFTHFGQRSYVQHIKALGNGTIDVGPWERADALPVAVAITVEMLYTPRPQCLN